MDDPQDLDSPEEIERLVRTFYGRVFEDDLLAPVFVDQAKVDLEEHIPKLTGFWCALELGIPGANVRPTQKHSELSAEAPFRSEQFSRWVALFHDTIDGQWSGAHAASMKARALHIAQIQSRIVSGAEPFDGPGSGAH